MISLIVEPVGRQDRDPQTHIHRFIYRTRGDVVYETTEGDSGRQTNPREVLAGTTFTSPHQVKRVVCRVQGGGASRTNPAGELMTSFPSTLALSL